MPPSDSWLLFLNFSNFFCMQIAQSLAVSLLMFSCFRRPVPAALTFLVHFGRIVHIYQSFLFAIIYRLRESISSGLPLFIRFSRPFLLACSSFSSFGTIFLRLAAFVKFSNLYRTVRLCLSGLVYSLSTGLLLLLKVPPCPIPSVLLLLLNFPSPLRQRCSFCQTI